MRAGHEACVKSPLRAPEWARSGGFPMDADSAGAVAGGDRTDDSSPGRWLRSHMRKISNSHGDSERRRAAVPRQSRAWGQVQESYDPTFASGIWKRTLFT